MPKTAAEKQREYRKRKLSGIKLVFKHETNAQKQKAYRDRHYENLKQSRMFLKKEVLTHYGGGVCSCVVCGENRAECLTIDHLNGSGRRHRKSIGVEGNSFYYWLKKNKYPDGYCTLCMNCQWVKRFENKEYNHHFLSVLGDDVTTVTSVASVASVTTVT